MKIARLPDTLISQIAAGEVIERPASVVKELVENAIDAGATRVEVQLEDGGLSRIAVIDDGSGMSHEDAALAVERHATSKLRTQDDLFRIHTLGFRGEALPSIASVSRFELCTRPAASDAGFVLRIEGGDRKGTDERGAPVGTQMTVSDLFFNQPARKKFQKTSATEQSHCVTAALRIGLAYPGVRVIVKAKQRTLLDLPRAAEDQRERIAAGLGAGIAPKLYPFALEQEGVRVHGFAGDPELQASDARNMYLYVNGRFVRDRLLQRAVLEGYRSLLPHGRYPTVVLFLDVPPHSVDVNVHPQKFEVRFHDGQRIFGQVLRAIGETLAKTPWLERGGGRVYQLRSEGSARIAGVEDALERANRPADPFDVPRAQLSPPLQSPRAPVWQAPPVSEPAAASSSSTLFAAGFFSRLRILTQFSNLYILCEGEGGGELVVVDQHAAHERITFERLLNAWDAGRVPQQRLLFPMTIKVRPDVVPLVEENQETLARIGLDMAPFGEDTIAVKAVPAIVKESRAKAYADEAIAELIDAGRTAPQELAHAVLARIACHASVRSGDPLTMPEMQALLKDLDQVDCGVRCPHGRPVVARVSRDQIGRWFERG
jgi:DNA mismatch repair protein MutL